VCDLDEPMFTSAAQKKAKPSNSNTGEAVEACMVADWAPAAAVSATTFWI